MTYDSRSSDLQGHLRNLVGQLSVELAQQRVKAASNGSAPAAHLVSHSPSLSVPPQPTDLPSVVTPYIAAHTTSGCVALEREALRTRSFPARDLIARVATRGRCGYHDLALFLEPALSPHNSPDAMALANGSDPAALLSLAKVVSAQRLVSVDDSIALSLYELVYTFFGRDLLGNGDWINFIGLLISSRRADRAARLLEESPLGAAEPHEHACLRANMLASGQAKNSVEHDWLAALNTLFLLDDIEPIEIVSGDRPRIDRISCSAVNQIGEGPLVSILMTNYCVGEALDTAVASVLNQSWRNIELILVDDCSPGEEFTRLQRLEHMDPRVRIYRTKANSGTYTGRNLALSHARGEFVTCHDSDDWSHPRKIELQVLDLLRNDTVGNLSRLARTTENLWLERFSATGKYVYPNTSSLMFRREPVVSRLGQWDPVRTGADTEFYKRMELLFGEKLSVLPGAPLSFARTRAAALTSGTLGMGWSAPARRYYRAAWAHWHRTIRGTASDPVLNPGGKRSFPAPGSILPSPEDTTSTTCEIVIIADMRCKRLVGSIASELIALTEAGIDVAICHVPALRRATAGRELVDPVIQTILSAGRIRRVELDTELDCKLALIRDPTVFQFSDGLDSKIRPEGVVVATDCSPYTNGDHQEGYSVTSVEFAVSRMFRKSAIWRTGNLLARERLELLLPGAVLSTPWHPLSVSSPETQRSSRPYAEPPIIGFCFPDAKTPWKAWGLMDSRLFPRKGSRVRVMGGRVPTHANAFGWDVIPQGEKSDTDFLSTVDFVPYFPQARQDEIISEQLAAALASGCIVLAPPRLAPLLGDGAVYVDVSSVKLMIDTYSGDRSAMEAQSRRAEDFVKEHLAPDAFVRRVRQLIPRNVDA